MEGHSNSTFNGAFLGYTTNKKSSQNYGPDLEKQNHNMYYMMDKNKYHATFLSIMLISHQCLFLALALLNRAYFRTNAYLFSRDYGRYFNPRLSLLVLPLNKKIYFQKININLNTYGYREHFAMRKICYRSYLIHLFQKQKNCFKKM